MQVYVDRIPTMSLIVNKLSMLNMKILHAQNMQITNEEN
jgi:hypothetical protein